MELKALADHGTDRDDRNWTTTTGPPLCPATPPTARVAAILIAIIEFKIDNRRLTRALEDIEQRPSSPRFYETAIYQWTHTLLRSLLADQ